ncbi:MAG: hypothetical protein ACRDQ7_05255 [Haloechinothrix sp.]
MHAVVGIWTAAESQREEQDRGLREQILPLVKAFPGFVAGYWMRDQETGKGYTTIVLDSAESARRFKALVVGNARAQAEVGITNDVLATVRVLAHEHADAT